MKKILITGGCGYIGENLYRRFKDFCDFGICDKEESKHRLIDAYYKSREAHELSFRDIEQYDAVVHLAALSGLAACEKDTQAAWRDNIISAMNVFELCTRAKIPVVFTSSQAAKTPMSSKYAHIKYTIECMANTLNNYGGEIYILRLSNVYGGYKYLEKKQTCVKQFITKYRKGEPFIIHGTGNQTRDFVHVYDVVNAIMSVLKYRPKKFDPIDIGTGIEISIKDLAKMFGDHPIKFEESRDVGTSSSIADIKTAEKIINFIAIRKLDEYIEHILKNKNVE